MADRPIIFSAPMVLALLGGRKTQTRRLAKPRGKRRPSLLDGGWSDSYVLDPGNANWLAQDVSFGIADRLYVREHWKTSIGNDGVAPRDLDRMTPVRYLADGAERTGYPVLVSGKHRQAMHMPRWASRLTLIVEDVRVQRLQDISEEDAIAEGIAWSEPSEDDRRWAKEFAEENGGDGSIEGVWTVPGLPSVKGLPADVWHVSPQLCYARLWDMLHTKPGHRWVDNPFVVALSFRIERGNIDTLAT